MNNNLTEVIFIMDASGSMRHLTQQTIDGFNGFIEEQKTKAGECKVTLVTFNDYRLKIHDCKDINEVPALTPVQYYPTGCTALYDAVGITVDEVGIRLAATREEERPGKVIVVITTDGFENASSVYSHARIKNMIELQQDTYNWSFIFMGANINAEQTGSSLGIKNGYSKTYSATSRGTHSVYEVVADSVSLMRSCAIENNVSSEEIDNTIATLMNEVE